MKSLFLKEIQSFFSSLTGYLIIVVYLLANSLMLWVIPGNFNLFDNGYASLEPLFVLSPWLFLFLVSAVTMKSIAEEKRMGTLEILLTKPLTEFQIVVSKYLASICLVMLAILPSLVFYFSIYQMGNPQGNIDMGGTLGSYIGLFFLASVYTAIGLFASTLTDNQIVAFIVTMIFSLFMYLGFDTIASMLPDAFQWISSLGIDEHYKSMSRGILDTRDIVYFVGIDIIFIYLAQFMLQTRKW